MTASIDLYWLPLGAGGRFVQFNGRVYEAIRAHRERRRPLDLYHSALEVVVPDRHRRAQRGPRSTGERPRSLANQADAEVSW